MGRRWTMMLDEAYAVMARRYAGLLIAAHWVWKALPWTIGALILGGLGYLAHAAWVAVTTPGPTPAPDPVPAVPVHTGGVLGAVPVLLWALAAVLIVLIALLSLPGLLPTRRVRRLRVVNACALLIVAAGIAGYGLSAVNLG